MQSSATSSCTATAFDTTGTCPECGGGSFDRTEDGSWYCRECGIVFTQPPVEHSEPGWRPPEERRTGPGRSYSHLECGTCIGHIGGGNQPRWAKYNQRLDQSTETLHHGLKEVRAVAAGLELPETTLEHAAYLFRKAIAAGHLQGQSIEAVGAACVCAAGKKFGPQLTFTWVADVSPVEKSRITTAYRKLVTTFDLPIEPATPKGILPRVADRVGVPGSIRRHARQVLQAVEDANEHIGQSPPGLAAAALYYTAQDSECELTQEEIAAAAGVSEATLSRQWRRIQNLQI